jgi:hypothetical protein
MGNDFQAIGSCIDITKSRVNALKTATVANNTSIVIVNPLSPVIANREAVKQSRHKAIILCVDPGRNTIILKIYIYLQSVCT